jgi:hypothetical protein
MTTFFVSPAMLTCGCANDMCRTFLHAPFARHSEETRALIMLHVSPRTLGILAKKCFRVSKKCFRHKGPASLAEFAPSSHRCVCGKHDVRRAYTQVRAPARTWARHTPARTWARAPGCRPSAVTVDSNFIAHSSLSVFQVVRIGPSSLRARAWAAGETLAASRTFALCTLPVMIVYKLCS